MLLYIMWTSLHLDTHLDKYVVLIRVSNMQIKDNMLI